MNLFELSSEIEAIQSAIIDSGGEIDPETYDGLNNLELAFDRKAESIAFIIRNLEAQSAAIANELERLERLKKVRTNGVEKLKRYLLTCMMNAGKTKVTTDLFTIRVWNNPGPSIECNVPLEELPAEFVTIPEPKPELNKSLIKELYSEINSKIDVLYNDYRNNLMGAEEYANRCQDLYSKIPQGIQVKQGKHIRLT